MSGKLQNTEWDFLDAVIFIVALAYLAGSVLYIMFYHVEQIYVNVNAKIDFAEIVAPINNTNGATERSVNSNILDAIEAGIYNDVNAIAHEQFSDQMQKLKNGLSMKMYIVKISMFITSVLFFISSILRFHKMLILYFDNKLEIAKNTEIMDNKYKSTLDEIMERLKPIEELRKELKIK